MGGEVKTVPENQAATPAGGGVLPTDVGPVWGLQDNGDLLVKLAGTEWRLTAAEMKQAELNLREKPQPLPGLQFRTARFDSRQKKLSITAGLAVPNLAEGEITLDIDSKGEPKLRGTLARAFNLPALGKTTLTVGLDEAFALTGSVEVPAANLVPAGIRGLTAKGSGTLQLAGSKLSGSGTVDITYADLGNGTVTFGFDEKGAFTGSGQVTITPPFVSAIKAELAADAAGNITAQAVVPLAGQASPVPNLSPTGGTVTVDYQNGRPALALSDFAASYVGFGSVNMVSLALDPALKPAGSGSFTANIPMLTTTAGIVTVRAGKVSGAITLGKDSFPEGLPIKSGSITATVGENGGLSFAGDVTADFGPAGTAKVAAAYGPTGFAISGAADLTVAGLNPIHLTASYQNGDLAGSVQVPVDSALLPGLSGDVTVTYAQGKWAGETVLTYSADGGKLSGSVTVTVKQNDEGTIELGGTGSVTAQLVPGLQGTLTATILPAGGVDVSGEILVTNPYELFPEQRIDKELFKYSQNIPLWAILVAVIRVRAGIRAGIGPGVFRDIKVTGSYTVGSEETDPSFSISGEMYIPAFVEGYVAFGAGLGLDVVLGSLTGGIEGVATAGIYGAISVVPELSYADGNWSIDGTATLAAGARFKLGLNAWAEVEAAWITVWENTWNLAELVIPIGPDLGLQAHIHYTFGQPEAPTLDFTTSDIDTEKLIHDAMPQDGPPGSGAREALENKAEWKGALKEKREPPPVPPEQAAQANAAPTPPAPPPKPPDTAPPAGAQAGGPGAAPAALSTPTPGTNAAHSLAVNDAAAPDTSAAGTVPQSALPTAAAPRYPNGINLAMLDEPAVPELRTAAQQQEDVAAATKLVELAAAQSSDSDALDNHFPRIKNRFRLTSIGWEGDFAKGFRVAITINPSDVVDAIEPLSGTGLSADMTHKTDIKHQTDTLEGEEVGVAMTARPLGPEHPAGSGPKGQQTLMSRLPTGYMQNTDAQANYIRGHLLNDWLGGPGEPKNLFPITQHANTAHLAAIEKDVKVWINEKRFWVVYEVIVKMGKKEIDATIADNYVNATLTAKAYVLNSNLSPNPVYTREVSIPSTFGVAPNVETLAETASTAALDANTARAQDGPAALTVQGTNRSGDSGPPTLQTTIADDLAKALSLRGRTRSYISSLLQSPNFEGMGPERITTMWIAYDENKANPGQPMTEFPSKGLASLTWIKNNWPGLSKLLP